MEGKVIEETDFEEKDFEEKNFEEKDFEEKDCSKRKTIGLHSALTRVQQQWILYEFPCSIILLAEL